MIGGEMPRSLHESLTAPLAESLRRALALAELGRVAAHARDREVFWRGRMLQRLEREYFGRVQAHPTLWWELPWLCQRLRERMDGRSPWLVDVCAWRSPLPIAWRRLDVTCLVIDGTDAGVDYTRWGARVQRGRLWEARLPRGVVGAISAVRPLEGATPDQRRRALAALAQALEPGGVLGLTTSVLPGRRDRVHGGSLETLLSEAAERGLRLELEVLPGVRGEGGEICGLILRREG
jgi:hypothetical protein